MTIPKECKRLAEVDFPIAEVSKFALHEKAIRNRLPTTLHLWWARRPLASSRAVLMALLLPDPLDPFCPVDFKVQARVLLGQVQRLDPIGTDLRAGLLKFIGDFANWDLAANQQYLFVARGLIKAAYPEETPLVADPFAGGGSIPFEALRLGCDTFAGDLNPVAVLIEKVMLEDIPRYGRQKIEVQTEEGEVFADGLAEALRMAGAEIRKAAEKELNEFYPKYPYIPTNLADKPLILIRSVDRSFGAVVATNPREQLAQSNESYTHYILPPFDHNDAQRIAMGSFNNPDHAFYLKRLNAKPLPLEQPIAYLWARTVRCESPNCGAEIPLMRSFWLSNKAKRRRALRPNVIRNEGDIPKVEFEIYSPVSDTDIHGGTIHRAKATCLCCNVPLHPDRVRAQLGEQYGGAEVIFNDKGERIGGANLLAVVTLKEGEIGRHYRLGSKNDYRPIFLARQKIIELRNKKTRNGLSVLPDEPTPLGGGSGAGRAFSLRNYGLDKFSDLFTSRQLLSFTTLCDLVDTSSNILQVKHLLAMVITKLADRCNSLVNWSIGVECPNQLFKGNALPMGWDFAESNLLSESSASIFHTLENTSANVEASSITESSPSSPYIADATECPLPDQVTSVWFTDPPYYDAVPYSDLSDFFLVWLKRALSEEHALQDPFDLTNPLSPKRQEIVQDETRQYEGLPKDNLFFEKNMALAFTEGLRVLKDDGVGCVVFAHKTTEGWEALLSGIINGGWNITSSWPIATERSARMRARDSAALESSVHLICRPRSKEAGIGDWPTVSRELPRKVGDWMQRLQSEGLRGADLVFACIGPALEIYSRYSKVVDAQDREIPLGGDPEANEPYQRGYLAYVWETVGRLALEQVLGSPEAQARNGNAGALEEDSRLTALFLWTMQSAGSGNGKSNISKVDEKGVDDDEEDEKPNKSKAGFKLICDVARRFAQPLGIHLEQWEGRIIETEKGVVRLIPITERASQLFGEEGAPSFVSKLERNPSNPAQLNLFPEMEATPRLKPARARAGKSKTGEQQPRREATTLDRLHATMLLQKNGQATALRAMLHEEMERSGDFLLLANSLSALYPRESEEKRLLDAMLVNIKR